MAGRPRSRETVGDRRERHAAVEDPQIVLEAALRFLEPRPRSVAEVRRRLTLGGYRADLVEGAIERLIELGMLDDAAFARAWVESRDRAHPRGELALRAELRQKGVDPAVLDEILADRRAAASPEAAGVEDAVADRLLDRHARTLGRIEDPRARRQRAYAVLARAGLDPETAARASARFVSRDRRDEGA